MVVLPVLAPVWFITTLGDTALLLGVSFALAPSLPSYDAQKAYGATRKSLTKAGLVISYAGAAALLIGNAKELWTNTGPGWAVTADLLIVVALVLIFCVAFRAETVRNVVNRLSQVEIKEQEQPKTEDRDKAVARDPTPVHGGDTRGNDQQGDKTKSRAKGQPRVPPQEPRQA